MPTRSVIFTKSLTIRLMASMAGHVAGRSYSTGIADLYSSGMTRNPNLWLPVDVSALAYTRNGQSLATFSPGLPITDRDVLFADHVFEDRTQIIGQTIRFVSMLGEIVDRTITAMTFVGNDHTIGRLSSPLPTNIKPAKILPPDWRNYIATGDVLPVVYTEQNRRLHIGGWTVGATSQIVTLANANYPDWYSLPITGDSGNGAGIILNREFVALGTWDGPATFRHIADDAEAVAACVGTPDYVDLSRYGRVA